MPDLGRIQVSPCADGLFAAPHHLWVVGRFLFLETFHFLWT